jgi:signal transduction histidine kinase
MGSFRDLSIKHKLTLLSVLASGSALIVACGAFVAYDAWTFRDAMVQTVSTQAKIVGYNSAASILFSDPNSATETLTALSAEPNILSAGVYTLDGKIFASYARDRQTSTAENSLPVWSPRQTDSHRFEANHLNLSRQIIFRDAPIGIVAIRADLTAMQVRQMRYVGIALAVLLVSTLGSIIVSLWFQRRISQPILDLAATAKRVSRDKDFSVRAKADSRDETGLLIGTFNEMLGRIQEQNDELQKARNELEQRVIARTAELEVANKELEAFSYTVSHDLRAPLRHIAGYGEMLQKSLAVALDESSRRYLSTILGAAKRMGQMIDHLLAFSKTGRATMQRAEVNLDRIVSEVIKELRADTDSRPVAWHIEPLPKVAGDPLLLRLVLTNLISNALKFTRTRAQSDIGIGSTSGEDEVVVFVRDNGVGFDMKYADKLFGVFQRLHRADEFEGTGIGLANVRRIVARHGGRTWVEGALDQGATFYFSLPKMQRGA